MSFLDTLRKNLTPEMYTQVTDALGDDFDFDLVPRSRLNKVIKQRNELREQLAGKSQPQQDKDSDDTDDDDQGQQNTGAKPAQQIDVKELEKQWQAKQDQAVKDVKIQYAALEKLRAANAIDAELIFNGGLIDKSKLGLDESGNLTGMDELIADLQKNKAHLFTKQNDGGASGTGKKGGEEPTGVSTKEDFLKLTAEQQIAFKQSNPTMFQKFLEQN